MPRSKSVASEVISKDVRDRCNVSDNETQRDSKMVPEVTWQQHTDRDAGGGGDKNGR